MKYSLRGLNELEKRFSRSPVSHQGLLAKELLKELYQDDLYLLCKYALEFKDINWHAHGEIITALENLDVKRKIICVPRGTFKSTIASIAYPLWRLIKNPDLRILIDSQLLQNSQTYLRSIKNIMKSPFLSDLFGEFEGDRWNETEITIAQRQNKKLKEASITCGGIETTKVGQHYDLIIGDDYNSPVNSESVEKCRKVIDHFRYNLNILDPGGEYLIIGTRYAELDVIGFILKDVLNEPHLAEGKLILNTNEKKTESEFHLEGF